jgi:hypothetical protein
MSKYICFTKLKHLIFWNGGSTKQWWTVCINTRQRLSWLGKVVLSHVMGNNPRAQIDLYRRRGKKGIGQTLGLSTWANLKADHSSIFLPRLLSHPPLFGYSNTIRTGARCGCLERNQWIDLIRGYLPTRHDTAKSSLFLNAQDFYRSASHQDWDCV